MKMIIFAPETINIAQTTLMVWLINLCRNIYQFIFVCNRDNFTKNILYVDKRIKTNFKSLQKFTYLLLAVTPILSSGQNAKEIVKRADDKMRGKTSQAEMVIKTTRPTWTREMSVKTWMKGTDLAMILIQSPVKDKGTVFLKRKKEVWNWLPTLERSIKLPPSMMSQSWMGTDFTNDDLVKESSVVDDYEHSVVGDTLIQGRNCYIIQMIPKPDAAVVWGKLIVCIDKQDYIELHSRFYDEDGSLINVMNAFDIKEMDGRLIPTRLVMIPANKKNQKTEIIYKKILFNRPIEDTFFSLDKMRNLK